MSSSLRRAAVPVAALLALTACSPAEDDGKLDVVASFYPLQLVAQEVGGDLVDVEPLTPPGAEPHDVELSPAQVSDIDGADLVVYASGFQPSVDDAVAEVGPKDVVDAAQQADLVAEEHDHEDETDEEHAEHEHEGTDPHFWLDPSRMPAVVDAVAAALTRADPDGADTFRANADALKARFTALDEEYAAALATCQRRTFVVQHEAFGYLAHRYGLEQVGISGIDPESEPSPARLREVGDVVRDEGVTTIFFESLASPKVAQTLAADLGVQAAVLDPIEGVTDDSSDYFSIASDNLEALRVALSCS